jgi:hypothetical protein
VLIALDEAGGELRSMLAVTAEDREPRITTTPHADDGGSTFEVAHPHHPLKGQRFKLVTYRHNWGEDRVYFHDSTGFLRSIPACWTTVLPVDPFVVFGRRAMSVSV